MDNTTEEDKKVKGTIKTIVPTKNLQGVFVSLTLDIRKQKPNEDAPIPVAVRVTYEQIRNYYRTGVKLTSAQYKAVCVAKEGGGSNNAQTKSELIKYFDKIVKHVKDIQKDGVFSFERLRELASKRSESAKTDFYEYWLDYAKTKNKPKTVEQYVSALNSFKAFKGADVKLKFSDITATVIAGWTEAMEKKGNANDTRSMYLRALRALLKDAESKGLIPRTPKVELPASSRRTDNFAPVADILKLRSFAVPDSWSKADADTVMKAIDYWMLLYTCNGCNTIDLAKLVWNDTYFYEKELSFTRSKMSGRKKRTIIVKIPIIPELQELLKKYGSEPKDKELVFPFILGDAKSDAQITHRVHDFNAAMRTNLAKACEVLKIRPITAQFARNSFSTCITHHGISDSYIDRALGHADNLLRGYQGEFSPKKRLKFNSLLFVDPEVDNESDELVERLKGIDPKELKKILNQLKSKKGE